MGAELASQLNPDCQAVQELASVVSASKRWRRDGDGTLFGYSQMGQRNEQVGAEKARTGRQESSG